jgi:hypothetical protein
LLGERNDSFARTLPHMTVRSEAEAGVAVSHLFPCYAILTNSHHFPELGSIPSGQTKSRVVHAVWEKTERLFYSEF